MSRFWLFLGLIAAVAVSSGVVYSQTTVNWSGSGDGSAFTDPGDWNPTPDGLIDDGLGNMILNLESLVNNFVVNDEFAAINVTTGDLANVTLDSTTAGGDLSFQLLNGFIDFADDLGIEDFGGVSGDGEGATTETLLIDGDPLTTSFTTSFVSAGLNVQLNSGLLTLRGTGNPINTATINFGGDLAGTLKSFETVDDFISEHLGKLSVNGIPAAIGGNVLVEEDSFDLLTTVTVLPDPAGPGDFDRSGSITSLDWEILRDNLFTTLTGVTDPALRFNMGDTDNNGDVNKLDFANFKAAYAAQPGGAPFSALTSNPVPEPTSACLAGLLSLAGIMAWRRRRQETRPQPMRKQPMPRIVCLVTLLTTLVLCGQSHAVTVVEELFTYADGAVEGLNGGTGWSTAWGPVVGDNAPPTGLFEVSGNAAVYNGNSAGQSVITQERTLTSALTATQSTLTTIDFDLTIGPNDTQIGRGIGVNFVDSGNIAFTLGKRLNGPIGIYGGGIGGNNTTNPVLGDGNFGNGVAGTFSLSGALSYNGVDTSLMLTDGSTTVSHSFAGTQIGFDAIQLTGYHQSTTGNGIDDLTVDVVQLENTVLTLQVDPVGNAALVNTTGSPIELDFYEVVSPDLNLDTSFAGIQGNDQSADGFPAGPGTGPNAGMGWEKAGGNSTGQLGEAYAFGTSTLADDGTKIELGDMFTTVDQNELLTFTYHDAATGSFVGGFIDFVDPSTSVPGDYNDSGQVEQGDLDLVLLNWGDPWPPTVPSWVNDQPTDGKIDQDDLDGVLLNWGNTSSVAAAGVVPEPASVLMLVIGGLLLARCRHHV